MFTQMKKRKYTKSLRAEQQEETRQRIIDALIALHQEVGPANTTVKAVAEKAGVQRLTVYRHFPDETGMLQACTSHWLELHPPPDMTEWKEIDDAADRSRKALLSFYRYYRQTEAMWNSSYRDVDSVEALQAPMAEFEAYLDHVTAELVNAWKKTKTVKSLLKTTLRHGLRFYTWQSLKNENLSDEKIATLVANWLSGIIESRNN
jgi:AcrR family transcriptional regulator